MHWECVLLSSFAPKQTVATNKTSHHNEAQQVCQSSPQHPQVCVCETSAEFTVMFKCVSQEVNTGPRCYRIRDYSLIYVGQD